jgi:CheY-like chemotaxis protein
MEVHALETGPKAISCLHRGTNVDFAILDMDMPEMDGIKLMGEIHSMRGYSKLPTILLTSVAGRGQSSTGIASGFVRYLTKPIKPKALLEVLLRAVRGVSEESQTFRLRPAP